MTVFLTFNIIKGYFCHFSNSIEMKLCCLCVYTAKFLAQDLFYGMYHFFVCSNGLYLFIVIIFHSVSIQLSILMLKNICMVSSYFDVIHKNVMDILMHVFGVHVEDIICEGN